MTEIIMGVHMMKQTCKKFWMRKPGRGRENTKCEFDIQPFTDTFTIPAR